jgi:uncharacterized protein YbcV (DUF1398 family)
MFTLEAIKTAHARVKSGADFPAYISEIKKMGVRAYESHVQNGVVLYKGAAGFECSSDPKYANLEIATSCNAELFKSELKAHQQGKTDYPAFCKISADCGIEKWKVDLVEMTCTYYDRPGNKILVEQIPTV